MLKPKAEFERARLASSLAVVLFLIAALLTIKTSVDLIGYRRQFPFWFVPSFVFGAAVLIAYSGYIAARVQASREIATAPSRLRGWSVWLLLGISFVSTTSVHGFYPFRPAPIHSYLTLVDYPVWAINMALPVLGVVGVAALWFVHRSGRYGTALFGVTVLGFLLLIPNDACKNPFNYWWLRTIGASPLMFVPNMYAALFCVAILRGVRPRLNTFVLAAVCVSTAMLGLGHMSRIVW